MKAEEYIKQHTRKGSNVFDPYAGYGRGCTPWLTVNDAEEVAKIAREEVIEKAVNILKSMISVRPEFYEDFYKVMNK